MRIQYQLLTVAALLQSVCYTFAEKKSFIDDLLNSGVDLPTLLHPPDSGIHPYNPDLTDPYYAPYPDTHTNNQINPDHVLNPYYQTDSNSSLPQRPDNQMFPDHQIITDPKNPYYQVDHQIPLNPDHLLNPDHMLNPDILNPDLTNLDHHMPLDPYNIDHMSPGQEQTSPERHETYGTENDLLHYPIV